MQTANQQIMNCQNLKTECKFTAGSFFSQVYEIIIFLPQNYAPVPVMFVVFIEMALTAVSYGLHIYLTCFLLFLVVVMLFIYRWLRFPRHGRYEVRSFLRRGTTSRDSLMIIGHRGGCIEAPENTIAAFKKAKENGASGVEFDIDFTKDGIPIIIHDATVNRTTDGSGNVGDFTYDEMRKLNASAKHSLR